MVPLATVVGSILVALGGWRVGVSCASDWGFIVGRSSMTTGYVSSERYGWVSRPAGLVLLVGITVMIHGVVVGILTGCALSLVLLSSIVNFGSSCVSPFRSIALVADRLIGARLSIGCMML